MNKSLERPRATGSASIILYETGTNSKIVMCLLLTLSISFILIALIGNANAFGIYGLSCPACHGNNKVVVSAYGKFKDSSAPTFPPFPELESHLFIGVFAYDTQAVDKNSYDSLGQYELCAYNISFFDPSLNNVGEMESSDPYNPVDNNGNDVSEPGYIFVNPMGLFGAPDGHIAFNVLDVVDKMEEWPGGWEFDLKFQFNTDTDDLPVDSTFLGSFISGLIRPSPRAWAAEGGGSRLLFVESSQIVIPEPTIIASLGIGIAGLAGVEIRRRRKKKAINC